MTNKTTKNGFTALVQQIVTIACGFITPKLILSGFGSEVNGLLSSITQFLAVVTFLEFGVGAVVQSSLYKPLAEHDGETISKIMASATKFFRKLAAILVVYVLVLVVVYPYISNSEFDHFYTGTLIICVSLSNFFLYYFGISNILLLTADQRGYIQYRMQTVMIIANTVVMTILILMGASIHVVKLGSSLVYLIRPFYLYFYVNRHYQIDRGVKYSVEPIQQKWNGLAQHISYIVLSGTDRIVLTIFTTLSSVSVYSIYYLVVSGVQQLLLSTTYGHQAFMGRLWAEQRQDELRQFFGWTEWLLHTVIVVLFGSTASLIVPFVLVYTNGINDANYNTPLFGLLITLAYMVYCMRVPYHEIIKAAGHYRQTQTNYFMAAGLNLVVSVLVVHRWGLVGVAIGTLIAMAYQTIWMAWYNSKNIICWPFGNFLKQCVVNVIVFIPGYLLCCVYTLGAHTYLEWTIMAVKVGCTWIAISIAVNIVAYPHRMKSLVGKVKILAKH